MEHFPYICHNSDGGEDCLFTSGFDRIYLSCSLQDVDTRAQGVKAYLIGYILDNVLLSVILEVCLQVREFKTSL